MPQCNIDQKGRLLRFFLGFILIFLGSILFVTGMPGTGPWWRVFQAGLLLLGVFMLIEGVMGWCALRALGRKTPL